MAGSIWPSEASVLAALKMLHNPRTLSPFPFSFCQCQTLHANFGASFLSMDCALANMFPSLGNNAQEMGARQNSLFKTGAAVNASQRLGPFQQIIL